MGAPFLLSQWLSASASRSPDAVAVRGDGAALTYGQLEDLAGRVAATLRELGVRRGDRVGLFLPKGLAAVAGLYGILRAGAAYVPIDPQAPATRAAGIAADCGLSALISDGPHIDALREVDPAVAHRGIACEATAPAGFASWDEMKRRTPAAPAARVVDTDVAYILYTSGSSGRPKGVAISHRSCLAFVSWACGEFGLQPDDLLSSHAPLHFDLSTFDFFGAVMCGATVSIVPAKAATFPVQLVDWIRSEAITVWYSVPSALSMLVRFGDLAARPLSSLRLVLFAGEVFPLRYLTELMRLVPQPRYVNLYGPTETNVCTFEDVLQPPADGRPVPIGRACANARGTVVDEQGNEVTGAGASGELYITGSTVAAGYWGDEQRTAAGFVAPSTYRTGDLVEILDDSDDPRYRFLGRRDHLVKTRGYRVELGEIEATLYAHPAVSECVAVAVPDDMLGSRIAAFCTVSGDSSELDLRRACGQRLPSYMVPERIFLVAEGLPRISTDKYDRQQLAGRAATAMGRTS